MPRKKRGGRAKPGRETQPVAPPREIEKTLLSRDLVIRGYWDRYPQADQRAYPDKYKHVRRKDRRGPTAYDVLANDYLSFTPAQRRKLRIKVTYGLNPDTGRVLSGKVIEKHGMVVDLPIQKPLGLASLRSFLIRAGVVDTPSDWKLNDNQTVEADALPLGIEWVTVGLERGASKPSSRKQSRPAKSSTKKRAK